jgi:hypothetical protein
VAAIEADLRARHRLLERSEADVRAALENVTILTHLESIGEKASRADEGLDRERIRAPTFIDLSGVPIDLP